MKTHWENSFNESEITFKNFKSCDENITKCAELSKILIDAYKNRKTVFTCGNGGSHCDSMHFAQELTGKFRRDRKPLAAIALGDASHMSCVSNDYGYDSVFSRQIEALGKQGDILIGISTSGNSQNVIDAIKKAKKIGVKTIGLIGKDGGEIQNLADLSIVVKGNTADKIQEVHIKIIHTAIETIERELFPENY